MFFSTKFNLVNLKFKYFEKKTNENMIQQSQPIYWLHKNANRFTRGYFKKCEVF